MKELFNPHTLRAVDRLVVTLDTHRFGAIVLLILVLAVAAAAITVILC